MSNIKFLILEDDNADAELLVATLKRSGLDSNVKIVSTQKDFVDAIDSFAPDLIISDHRLPQLTSTEALEIARKKLPYIPFILVTGTVSDEFAASIIKEGADDYLLKSNLKRLPTAIQQAIEKKQTEKAQALLVSIINSSDDAIISVSLGGNITSWNTGAERIFGYSQTEAAGRNISLIIPQDRLNEEPQLMDKIMSGELIDHYETQRMKKNGELIHLSLSVSPIKDTSGNIIGASKIARDITERKKAEEELNKSNERFKYVTKATSDVIWELNFETKQSLIYEGKEKLTGITSSFNWRNGITGKYIAEEDRDRIRKSFSEAKKDPGCELWRDEYSIYSSDKSLLHITNYAFFFRNKQGKPVRAIGAITDITEKKNLEVKLFEQRRQAQLKITATALDAQEKERNAIGQELHDNVNQLLVATKMALSMIAGSPERTTELISSSMKNLHNAISENRKIAHELVTPDLKTENLADQLNDLTDKMLKAAGIETYIDTSRFQEKLLNDNHKLAIYRITQEQCTNISKHAEAKKVNITLSTINGLLKMIIADDGMGMDRGKKTDGIGLRNIKGRLSIFNGTTHINTEPGKGFTLEITIPLKK